MKKLTLLLWGLSLSALAQKQITVRDLYSGVFYPKTLPGLNWMNDGQYYTLLENNQIVRYDVTTGKQDSVIVDGRTLDLIFNDYRFTPDESKVLLLTDKQYIYRRSFTANYYIYTFKDEELQKLSLKGRQSYATISPDNKKVAFVRENNLFYVELANMVEYPVTTDGKFGGIINGSADWVYEEELELTKAFAWSSDSEKLAFYRFDERKVKEYNLQYWGNGALYPQDYRYKYPKAGEANAVVTIKVYNLNNNEMTTVDLGKEKDVYIPQIRWTKNPNLLGIKRLNRWQNAQDIFHYDLKTKTAIKILTEKSKTYIDFKYTKEWIYLNDGKHFLMATERKGNKQFVIHRMDGQLEYEATSSRWEAESLAGLDQRTKTPVLYYVTTEGSQKGLNRYLYRVNYKGKNNLKLSMKEGINGADVSKDFKYYINFNDAADHPTEISLMMVKGNKLVKTLEENAELKANVKDYDLSPKILFQLDAADKKQLNAYMIQPPNMDSTKQYPVLMYQYSGPGSQNVANSWGGSNYYWHQMMAQKGYVVVVADPRGTGGRGEVFKKMTYMKMGKMESDDQIAVAKQLGKLPFVDKNRIGIWGWSYGGYVSALTLMEGPKVFKAGISVAPFLWRYYDTIYTERYLRRPQDNPSGYDDYSIIKNAAKLKANYLLIHGTGDDNVHFQATVFLQNALIEQGIQFQSFFYPDKAHSIGGLNTRIHLFTLMTNFLLENL